MIEKALLRIEEWEKELSFLKEFNILPNKDIEKLINQRRKYEEKLASRHKSKLDYLEYIRSLARFQKFLVQYRHDVLKDEDRLRQITETNFRHNKFIADLGLLIRSTSNHISKLFRSMVMQYQFDPDLCIAYIDYAKEQGWNHRVSALYWRLLRVKNLPEIWIQAAKFEAETNKAFDTSRALYLTALRHHPKDSNILLSFLEMEIAFMSFVHRRRNVLAKKKDDSEADPITFWDDDESNKDSLKQVGLRNMSPEVDGELEDRMLSCGETHDLEGTAGLNLPDLTMEKVDKVENDKVMEGELVSDVYREGCARLVKGERDDFVRSSLQLITEAEKLLPSLGKLKKLIVIHSRVRIFQV